MRTPDADLLPEVARRLDEGADDCSPDCAYYHRVWGYLRLFGGPRAVENDHDLLLDDLASMASRGARRVLISGTADCGILAYVIAGFERAGVRGSVHVTDRCATPLHASQWYAERRGWQIETTTGDIRDFREGGFDIVVAHNFLNFFTPDERPDVARVWHDSLRPGGQLLLVAAAKSRAVPGQRRYSPERTEHLVRTMLEGQRQSPHASVVAPERFERLIRDFAENRLLGSPSDAAAITDPLHDAGLHIVATASREMLGQPGSGEPAKRQRYRIIAERPSVAAA